MSDALQDTALRMRPELQAAKARIEGAESMLGLAKREYYPDLTLRGSYNSMWAQPDHRFMVGLSINLPIQLGRRRGATEEAQAKLLRSQSEYERKIVDCFGEIQVWPVVYLLAQGDGIAHQNNDIIVIALVEEIQGKTF